MGGVCREPVSYTHLDVYKRQAYNKAFTKENIENGFKMSGIFPFNENIFKDDEFLSSFVTDRELIEQDKIPDKDQYGETSNYVRYISSASIESNPPSCSNLNLQSSSDYNLSLIHI